MRKFLSRLGPFQWTLHNIVAHPVSELVYLLGFCSAPAERLSNWIHDITMPAIERTPLPQASSDEPWPKPPKRKPIAIAIEVPERIAIPLD